MEKDDKGSTMIRMGVSGWMFLLVPAYPGCPGSKAVKRSLLLLSGTTRVSRYQKGKTNLDCIQPVKELKIEWWGVGVVICLGRGAVVCIMVQHDATAIPNPIISCLVWIQTGFTLLVPAYPGCQGKRLLNGCSSSSWSWKPAVNMQFHQKPAPGTKWM